MQPNISKFALCTAAVVVCTGCPTNPDPTQPPENAAVLVEENQVTFFASAFPNTSPYSSPSTQETSTTTETAAGIASRTALRVTFSPFSLVVLEGERGERGERGEQDENAENAESLREVARTEAFSGNLDDATGAQACAPLMLLLRSDDDTGGIFHRPDGPPSERTWLVSSDAVLLNHTENSIDLEVHLVDPSTNTINAADTDATNADMKAILHITIGKEGFIEANVSWPFADNDEKAERALALGGSCWHVNDDTHALGGGERFGKADLRGVVTPLYFAAPGPFASDTNESHAPVPFLATTDGWSILVETERVGAFDFAASKTNALQMRFQGKQLPLRIRADAIAANISAHARFMGLPPSPPVWAMAPMQWRNEHDVTVQDGVVISTGADRMLNDAEELRARKIPTTALWFDAPWQTGYNTFVFNEVQFPNVDNLILRLRERGFVHMAWATEYVNKSDDQDQMFGMPPFASLDMFNTFSNSGFLVKNADGTPFVFPWARGQGAFLDFSNPEAQKAHHEILDKALQRGIQGFKLDFCETMRADLLGAAHNDLPHFADGATTREHHTRYARLYHETFLQELRKVYPTNDDLNDGNFIITRTGGIYDQKNGVAIWPGDLDNDFSENGVIDAEGSPAVGGLPAAIAGHLSLASSGYPLYGSDIGGYRGGTPNTEVLLRWAQFGAMSTIMQLGGGGTGDATHNPWEDRYQDDANELGIDASKLYQRYARLHMDLWPFWKAIIDAASESGDGTPVLLPVGAVAALGTDTQAWQDQYTYIVGDTFLVAPIVTSLDGQKSIARTIRLPEGEWVDFWTGERYGDAANPTSIVKDAPIDILPLFQKAGKPVVMSDPRLLTLRYTDRADDGGINHFGKMRVIRTSNIGSIGNIGNVGNSADNNVSEKQKIQQVPLDGKQKISVTQENTDGNIHLFIEKSAQTSIVTPNADEGRVWIFDFWLDQNLLVVDPSQIILSDVFQDIEWQFVTTQEEMLQCESACLRLDVDPRDGVPSVYLDPALDPVTQETQAAQKIQRMQIALKIDEVIPQWEVWLVQQ